MFGILERWNNNQVTPSLSKPHELSYRSNSSTLVPENPVEERTRINLSENSLTCKRVTSNHDSDDNSTDNE